MNYERITRKLRQRIFDYPESKAEKADRVLRKAIAKKIAQYPKTKHPTGKYSGLTKRELALTGTCETDWF